MSRLNDVIEEAEFRLEKYPGTTGGDLLNRRLILRDIFTAWGTERYSEGVGDGRRDVFDTRAAAERPAVPDNGPFQNEREASAAARSVIPPEPGWSILSQAQRAELLHRALEAAGVETSEYEDARAWWLGNWSDDLVAVIDRWVTRAHEAGLAARGEAATEYGVRFNLYGSTEESAVPDEAAARRAAESMRENRPDFEPVVVVQREAARPAGPWRLADEPATGERPDRDA